MTWMFIKQQWIMGNAIFEVYTMSMYEVLHGSHTQSCNYQIIH